MLNSIVMAQSLEAKQTTLRKTVFTSAGTQATPESSSLKIVSPGWRSYWVWYLAEAPALSAVACNSVLALTLLSGSTPPEKNPLSLCGGESNRQ